jgi:hypothetical protein
MKKILIAITIVLLYLPSCTGIKTTISGLENEAFIEFLGNPSNYQGGIDVDIDGSAYFKAEVNKNHANRPKGKTYAISTGTHTIKVSYKGNLLVQKKIFVSNQETKKIILQ